MNLSFLTTSSGYIASIAVILGLVLLALTGRWCWKEIRRGRAFTKNQHSINSEFHDADQFIFDDEGNDLQSELEEKLSGAPITEPRSRHGRSELQEKSARAKRTTSPVRPTKQEMGLSSHASETSSATLDNPHGEAHHDKTDSTVSENHAQTHEHHAQTAVITASEIERLSFHLESTKREIASLADELAAQTYRVSLIEKDTPQMARREVKQKITLLANSVIKRNGRIQSLGADYKRQLTQAAQIAKTDHQGSQRLMQQCKVIKLQIKLEGQQLEKDRLMMSNQTRLHHALQAPQAAHTSSMLQLADQTNEIRNQNANLKSLLDNLNAEFSQLRSIVDGLKSDIGSYAGSKAISPRHDKSSAEDKRPAANDASIATHRGTANNNSAHPAKKPRR